MQKKYKHTILDNATIKDGLNLLNELNGEAAFIVSDQTCVLGSLTDGDIRRALLSGHDLNEPIVCAMNRQFKHIRQSAHTIESIDKIKSDKIDLIPIINENGILVKLINLKEQRSALPLEAILMAGGRGERLRPLTDDIPKPLLVVGDKPIIDHNIDRLSLYGIERFFISVKYKSELIVNHLKNGDSKRVEIEYLHEDIALGTLGCASLITNFKTNAVLVMNSDVLTNIDFEDFYRCFEENDADMVVASSPYRVDIPYGVMETKGDQIIGLKEKPCYQYYANAGIYLIKTEHLKTVPKNSFYNATDLIEQLIKTNNRVINYPITQYWMDIGQHEDYEKAQEDIKHLRF